MNFTVDMIGVGNAPPGASVFYEIIQLTALEGIDYEDDVPAGYSGTLPLPTTSEQISIKIVGDVIPELEERFLVRISNPVGGTLTPEDSVALGVIEDNDPIRWAAGFSTTPTGTASRTWTKTGSRTSCSM